MKKIMVLFMALVFSIGLSVSSVGAVETKDFTWVNDYGGKTISTFEKNGDYWINTKEQKTIKDQEESVNEYYTYTVATATDTCKKGEVTLTNLNEYLYNCVAKDTDGDLAYKSYVHYFYNDVSLKYDLLYYTGKTFLIPDYENKAVIRYSECQYRYYILGTKLVKSYEMHTHWNNSKNYIKNGVYTTYNNYKSDKDRKTILKEYEYRNNSGIRTLAKGYAYHTNGYKKAYFFTSSFYKNNNEKMTTYTKYSSKYKDRKLEKKITYLNDKNKATKLITYAYNKQGVLKSNKTYGSAYKYVTVYKDLDKQDYFKNRGSYPTKSITKAKYSVTGKLGKASKTTRTTLNNYSFSWNEFYWTYK